MHYCVSSWMLQLSESGHAVIQPVMMFNFDLRSISYGNILSRWSSVTNEQGWKKLSEMFGRISGIIFIVRFACVETNKPSRTNVLTQFQSSGCHTHYLSWYLKWIICLFYSSQTASNKISFIKSFFHTRVWNLHVKDFTENPHGSCLCTCVNLHW